MAATITRWHLTLCYNLATVALLLAFLHPPTAEAQPLPWQLCNATSGNYTEGSTYQANVRALARTLPGNASSSPALFATDVAGAAPDRVYAIALCRGDTNASSCASCVANAFLNAQQLCALNKRATMFDDPCILRFSDQDILANVTDNRGMFVAWNYNNVSAAKAAAFDAASGRLVNATAEYAAADPVRRFGTGEMGFDDATYPRIFSLAQCTPDMSEADCRSCLGDIIRRMTPKYFAGKPGGRVFGVRCNFRFESYSFYSGRPLLQLSGPPPAPSPANVTPPGNSGGKTTHRTGRILAITLPIAGAVLALIVLTCFCFWRKRTTARKASSVPYSTDPDDIKSIDSLLLDLSTIRAATDNFAETNKLGEGGFGAVYKGVLPEGREIAVKRLSQHSTQGIEELKTELVLVAKLRHKNLVSLVGVCLEGDEKLLVYEFMPNKSLDTVLFDSERSKDLDWVKRLKIVSGVARGLQYLHEDSQLRVVHRDLKASNVLLDLDYNPKISDFGLAKLFGWDQTQDVTSHIAGTYGYMAPEYAMRGQYSVKSDAFSFGVLILEIVTGRRNSSFANSEHSVDILSLVWEHWTMGTIEELLDPAAGGCSASDLLKLINVGLLCVQDNPADRPAMSAVNVMLSSSTVSLQAPSRPTFCIQDMDSADVDLYSGSGSRGAFQSAGDSKTKTVASPNEVSLTELEPR
ncbi:cysteine-rich receptor-like protein kinase 10 [Oryza brachyantha]|uniref:cysteine-rich receptor-like protein kinase 10 n=1 Tax=Oryza brachyantha TaxID=4533 RepID=UPI001ADB334D|nr:cysteine-rich receptor-like protein kinase 10 [Oryza brachyantha]